MGGLRVHNEPRLRAFSHATALKTPTHASKFGPPRSRPYTDAQRITSTVNEEFFGHFVQHVRMAHTSAGPCSQDTICRDCLNLAIKRARKLQRHSTQKYVSKTTSHFDSAHLKILML